MHRLSLSPEHVKFLAKRGISEKEALALGYRTVTTLNGLNSYGFPYQEPDYVPGLVIPLRSVEGKLAYYQYRPDVLHGTRKYLLPAGAQHVLHVPAETARMLDEDPSLPLLVTEGAIKSDAAALRGVPTVSIQGVDCFSRDKKPLPDWAALLTCGRRIVITFDSDIRHKLGVRTAALRLQLMLKTAGVEVSFLIFEPDGTAKVGLDDFLTANPEAGLPELLALESKTLPGAQTETPEEEWIDPIPLSRPSPPVFPLEMLPAVGRSMVESVAQSRQVAACFPAMVFLGVLAAANAGQFRVRAYGDWTNELALWPLCSLPSGERKSPVMDDLFEGLREYADALREEGLTRRREAVAHNEILNAQIKGRLKQASASDDPEARNDLLRLKLELKEVPEVPQLIGEDCTMESLARLMQANFGRLVIVSDEGAPIQMILGRYSQDSAAVETALKGYSGSSITVNRVRGDLALHIPSPQLTYVLAVQPEVLRAFREATHLRGVGVAARFLYCIPESRVGFREAADHGVPAHVREAYRDALNLMVAHPADNDGRSLVRRELRLSEGAVSRLQEFEATLEARLRPGGDGNDLVDWLSKLAGNLVRIAANLHLFEAAQRAGDRTIVTEATMVKALSLAPFLEAHARAALLDRAAPEVVIRTAERIVEWAHRKGKKAFTAAEVFKGIGNTAALQYPDDLSPGLGLLERSGYIRATEDRPGIKGGRPPKAKFTVNPRLQEVSRVAVDA